MDKSARRPAAENLSRFGYQGDFVLELLETTEAVRKKCTPEWHKQLARWLALANGVDS